MPFPSDIHGRGRAVYLHRWTANGRRWTGGEELEVRPSLPARARIWPADDETRPVTNGRVPWSGGIEGVVVNLSDVLELVARS
jgi:hypothetical protein